MNLAVAANERAKPNPAALAMANRFSRYKPEEEHKISKADVQCDELTYLRQKREMLRGMTPEQAFQVIEFRNYLNAFQALDLAKREGKLIVPNDIHDRIMNETDACLPLWTGTAMIYGAPDKPFGDKVVHGWKDCDAQYAVTFDVPEQFRGKTNCALVVEHPDFEFVQLGHNDFQLKAADGYVALLEQFPKATNQCHECDRRFRIPMGDRKENMTLTKWLCRHDNEYIGLVAVDDGDGTYTPYVGLDFEPSDGFWVAVF